MGNIDEVARTGDAVWELVPAEERPQSEGDPRYVESVLAFGPLCGAADDTPVPEPCGAALRVLDHLNHVVDPASQALSVSNHVSTDGSLGPEVAAFDAVSSDRDAFRFEVENPVSDDPVSVALTIADRLPILYNLDARSGNRYRSHFLRLVGDGEDVSRSVCSTSRTCWRRLGMT